MPQSTSDRWFSTDVMNAIRLASRWSEFASCDTDCRKNALCELAFNMGGRWEQFIQTRAAITAQEWQTVHDHLLASLWAKQVQPHGFNTPGRATRIAGYFLTGQYP